MLSFRASCVIALLCLMGCKQQDRWEHTFLTEEGARNVAAICVDQYWQHNDEKQFEQCMIKFGFVPKRNR